MLFHLSRNSDQTYLPSSGVNRRPSLRGGQQSTALQNYLPDFETSDKSKEALLYRIRSRDSTSFPAPLTEPHSQTFTQPSQVQRPSLNSNVNVVFRSLESVGKTQQLNVSSNTRSYNSTTRSNDQTKKQSRNAPHIAQVPFTPFTKTGRRMLEKERTSSDIADPQNKTRSSHIPPNAKSRTRSLSSGAVPKPSAPSRAEREVFNPQTESFVTKEDREIISSADLPKWEGKSRLVPYLFGSTSDGGATTSSGMTNSGIPQRTNNNSLLSSFSIPSEDKLFPSSAPPSLIDHVKSTVAQTHVTSEELWNDIVSSAARRVPSTREESELLEKWVDCEILRLKVLHVTRKEYYRKVQRILARAFQEVIRQVTSTCSERGRLLTHLWMLYVTVFEVCYSSVFACV